MHLGNETFLQFKSNCFKNKKAKEKRKKLLQGLFIAPERKSEAHCIMGCTSLIRIFWFYKAHFVYTTTEHFGVKICF